MRCLAVSVALLLGSCAASPEKLEAAAREESARLTPPSRSLASFADYVLLPITLGPAVQEDERKVTASATLQEKLTARIEPMLATWRQEPRANRSGTLLIQPNLVALRIVSGGARFWAGAFAGDSSIDLDLRLTAQGTGEVLANVRVQREAGGYAGGWSVGKSDQNLHDYIVAIVARYLADGYGATTP